jgi:Ca2+/Na+ antiporter
MTYLAGSPYALFALVWGLMCLLAAAVVTETMVRDTAPAAADDVEQAGAASVAEV